MSVCAWVKMTSPSTTPQVFVGKDGVASREYILAYSLSGSSRNVFSFAASPPNPEVYATSFGAANAGQWYFVVGTYDGTNQKIYVNAIASGSSTSSAPIAGAAPFTIGERNYTGFNNFVNGSISGVGFWSRALSSTEITTLYNEGIGLTYSGIVSAGLTTNLNSYWALNQVSVTADSAGSNTLTNNGTITATVLSPIATSTASSRQLINSFVKGVKAFGLWSSMVCWPLRSSQNTSTTYTAKSLGGLGTYDGTLTNYSSPSAAWLSDGLLLGGAANYVTTSGLNNGGTKGAWISAMKYSALGTQAFETFTDISHVLGGTFAPYADNKFYMDWTTAGRLSVNSGTTANAQYFFHGDVGGGVQTIYKNGSQLATQATAITNTNTAGYLVKGYASSAGSCSFLMFSNSSLASVSSDLYNLYKNTLGVGLGLP